MTMKSLTIAALALLSFSVPAFATLSLDRTRIIYNEVDKGANIVVTNTDKKDPFLAQAWIENIEEAKVEEPLIALPMLQRINAHEAKQVKITTFGNTELLPKDRESMFYLNILGVPPKGKAENAVEFVIQSKLRVFFRPKGLELSSEEANKLQSKLNISRQGQQLLIENPTAYYVYIKNINSSSAPAENSSILLAPFETKMHQLRLKSFNNVMLGYVNDYGSLQFLSYNCAAEQCILKQETE